MMKHIWNISQKMCSSVKKSNRKEIAIRVFILLNSLLWGTISVLAGFALKTVGAFPNVNTAMLLFVITGYTVCFLGIIGGEIYALKHETEGKIQ